MCSSITAKRSPSIICWSSPSAAWPTAAESDAALVATDVSEVEVRSFRIIGDAATPLGTGILVQQSDLALIDIEVQGARQAAVVFATGASGAVMASDLHDNPGIAIDVRSGAAPRIIANHFARNATARSAGTIIVCASA